MPHPDLPAAPLTKRQRGEVLADPDTPHPPRPEPPGADPGEQLVIMSVRVPDSLRRRLKKLAVDTDRTMQTLCQQALEELLAKRTH